MNTNYDAVIAARAAMTSTFTFSDSLIIGRKSYNLKPQYYLHQISPEIIKLKYCNEITKLTYSKSTNLRRVTDNIRRDIELHLQLNHTLLPVQPTDYPVN